MFSESFGVFREKGDAWHMLNSGFTFLFLPNLLSAISAGTGINEFSTCNDCASDYFTDIWL